MRTALPKQTPPTRSHRPRAVTVFAAAFVAGAAAAVGVNRTLDVRLAQSKPRVESEAIFVALRSLPQGAPVTVWDVALRDWPKAMMPVTALRASDTFSGHVLKHPLREGQPLLSIQLAPAGQGSQPAAEPSAFPPPAAYTQTSTPAVPATDSDLWSPAEPVKTPALPPAAHSPSQAVSQAAPPPTQQVTVVPAEASTSPIAAPTATTSGSEIAQQQPVAAIETPPVESATTTAGTVDQPLTDSTAATIDSVPAPEATTASDLPTPEESVATPATEPVVATAVAPSAEPATPQAADPQPQAVVPEPAIPAATASSDVPPPAATAAVGVTPQAAVAAPFVAAPIQAAPPTATTATLPTPPSPSDRPRPTHSRYLVVPESIAVQADASFTARAASPQQPAAALPSAVPQASSRSASAAVRPLPSTTERVGQAKPQAGSTSVPQARPPQRHGRQAQPANPGAPANTTPQPRLGAAMFPTISAGINAIEGRIRRDQPAHGEAPAAAPSRPVMAR